MPRYRRHGRGIVYEGARLIGKVTMAKGTFVGQDAFVAGDVTMKHGSQINPHAEVIGKVVLEPYAVVGYGACVIATTYTTSGRYMCEASEERNEIRGSVVLEEGAYVGANAVVCVSRKTPNITIGERAVVGALTYVDRNVPAKRVLHARGPLFRRTR